MLVCVGLGREKTKVLCRLQVPVSVPTGGILANVLVCAAGHVLLLSRRFNLHSPGGIWPFTRRSGRRRDGIQIVSINGQR